MWVGYSPGAAADSETVSGLQVRLHQAGHLFLSGNGERDRGAERCQTTPVNLTATTLQPFVTRRKNTVELGEHIEKVHLAFLYSIGQIWAT